MKNSFKILLFVFVFLFNSAFAIHDSLIFKFNEKLNHDDDLSLNFNGTKIRLSGGLKFNGYAKYINNFSPHYTHLNFNDSTWQTINFYEEIGFNNSSDKEFTVRFYFKVEPSFKTDDLIAEVNHIGASALYLNGTTLKKFGKPSNNSDHEVCEIPIQDPLYFNLMYDSVYVLVAHYSNSKKLESEFYSSGLALKFYKVDNFITEKKSYELFIKFLLSIGCILFALSTVYFHLFIFNRGLKYNLYYFLFLLALSFCFLTPQLYCLVSNPTALLIIEGLLGFFVPASLCALLLMVYSLFQIKRSWYFYLMIILFAILFISSLMKESDFSIVIFILLFLLGYFGITIIAIKALLKKLNGANYLGAGIVAFTVFIFIALIVAKNGNNMAFSILFIALSILALPLFMSSFLSKQFATINKSLKAELKLNEELAQKSLQQEKEKQEILANQNKHLEEQVINRTIEITEQKKELECKNIEITDSIVYSKHIQDALLPDESEILKYFINSFILFKPKDIVSGDFYWFKKNSDNEFLIAAADCTGHGVPGALVSLIAIQSLNRATELESDVCQILKQTNNVIKSTLKQNDPENAKDGMDIALCKINFLQDGKISLSYAGANRPMYLLKKGNTEITEIKATKFAIGGFTEYNQDFNRSEFIFESGDSVYLTSDGYADQFGSEKNKKLTTKRFKELLAKLNYLKGREQKSELEKFINSWCGKLEQIDDILIVGLKF